MYTKVKKSLEQLGIDLSIDPSVLKLYSTDESIFEVMPQMVVYPHNTDEVQKIVRVVDSYTSIYPDISLTVRAAGTGLSGGSLNDSIILDIKYLDKIGEVDRQKEYAYLEVGPGAYFRDIEKEGAAKNYFFPPCPSSKDICTIGGMIANNAAGPNSLKYGHTVDFIEELEVVMSDGVVHTFTPISYTQLLTELERKDQVGALYQFVWDTIISDFDAMRELAPDSTKNSAGYELWDVLDAESVDAFMQGGGTFSLIHVFAGSQGTIGVITNSKIRLIATPATSDLLVIPIRDVTKMGVVIQDMLEYHPYNVEIFDKKTYKLALKHPIFFKSFLKDKKCIGTLGWLGFLWQMYGKWMRWFGLRTPEFILLVKLDGDTEESLHAELKKSCAEITKKHGVVTRHARGSAEQMMWVIRGTSYSLAKLGSESLRPAAFLEDMVVPPAEIPQFITEVQKKLAEYGKPYAMHGHGGNGHFHFYPLFDFTDPETPATILKMSGDFFNLAQAHGGNICGEHNDGIMRTPFLDHVFSDQDIRLFEKFEHTADPQDIFNPGKKVNPKFDIIKTIRTTN